MLCWCDNMSENKPYGTVLIRAKQIMDYLEQINHPANLQEIYTSLHMSKSTALKIINTLCMINYLKRNEETKKYTLGVKLISYGEAARRSFSIASIAEPELTDLNNEIGETVHLGVFENNKILYIKKLNGKGKIILRSQIGRTLDLYCSGMGKAYLAEQSKEYILDYLNQTKLIPRTQHTITDTKILLDNLNVIKENGYAIDDQENEDEIYCISTVIKDTNDHIQGLISISSPVFRINEQKKRMIIRLLKRARAEIETKLN